MIWRVHDQGTFRRLRRSGHRGRHGHIVVSWVDDGDGERPRVAFALARKVGTAVTRNRIRRRLWHHLADRQRIGARVPAGDYLVTVLPGADAVDPRQLRSDLDAALDSAVRS